MPVAGLPSEGFREQGEVSPPLRISPREKVLPLPQSLGNWTEKASSASLYTSQTGNGGSRLRPATCSTGIRPAEDDSVLHGGKKLRNASSCGRSRSQERDLLGAGPDLERGIWCRRSTSQEGDLVGAVHIPSREGQLTLLHYTTLHYKCSHTTVLSKKSTIKL